MNMPPDTTGPIRQIQALAVLLSCLPPDGKVRELFSLALSLDDKPWLDRIAPVVDPEGDAGDPRPREGAGARAREDASLPTLHAAASRVAGRRVAGRHAGGNRGRAG